MGVVVRGVYPLLHFRHVQKTGGVVSGVEEMCPNGIALQSLDLALYKLD